MNAKLNTKSNAKLKIAIKIIFIILYIALISFITFTSLQSGSSSGGFSFKVMEFISKITNIQISDTFHYIIRKLVGHFGLNFVLGILGFIVYLQKNKFKTFYINLITGLILCIYNESLQLFTSGRNFDILDILIDYSGVISASCLLLIIFKEKKMKKLTILVTGGCGYIGSHTVIELLNNNHEVIVCDNLCNSKKEALNRVKQITGKDVTFYETDIRDYEGLDKIFKENKIDCVIHFAGLKAVGESCKLPLKYYDNNIGGTNTLLSVMENNDCLNIIFSSSATVYGDPEEVPIKETAKLNTPTNPYGKTKLFIENILKDIYNSNNKWNICLLRYFNPIGAHPSGLIGEDPNGIPNNLMPYITQVAIGRLDHLNVFGNDYDTHDGTGVRDYIHVCDLARGHVYSLNDIINNKGLTIYNLGTGVGYSVLDIVKEFSKVIGFDLKYEIAPRRSGDIATCYSDPSKAYRDLGFKTEKTLHDMCCDSWRWQKQNPNGLN